MIRMDGKEVSAHVRETIKEETAAFIATTGVTPGLAVIIVGNDPASAVYVRNKHKACNEVGFQSFSYELPEDTTEQTLLNLITELNQDDKVHGILVQLPLPKHIDESKILLTIDPSKDVDAFHPYNVGKIMIGNYHFIPCTPAGVMEILKYYQIGIEGQECVVVGRSNIVGKPQAMLLMEQNGTVTVCHSRTRNLKEVCRRADIIVVAIGRPRFLTADMVKKGAVVVDVGINRLPDGKLVGDVDYDAVSEIASAITPVPGGVGPMTITMLMKNTLAAAKALVK